MNSEKILASGEALLKCIPQRKPFVMIDCLYECNDKSVRTGFVPTRENIFSSKGIFTEPGLLENMAQTAAAGTGYSCLTQGKSAPVGFIGAIKDFQLNELPDINAKLETEVHVIARVMNATVIRAQVNCGGKVIASCEMKIFLLDGNVVV